MTNKEYSLRSQIFAYIIDIFTFIFEIFLENLLSFLYVFSVSQYWRRHSSCANKESRWNMLLDRFTASYYQSRGKLKSLITVKKLELHRDVGVLFAQDREDLAKCLINYQQSNVLKSAQTFTDTYKVMFINYETRFVKCCPFSPDRYLPRLLAYLQWLACYEAKSKGTKIWMFSNQATSSIELFQKS